MKEFCLKFDTNFSNIAFNLQFDDNLLEMHGGDYEKVVRASVRHLVDHIDAVYKGQLLEEFWKTNEDERMLFKASKNSLEGDTRPCRCGIMSEETWDKVFGPVKCIDCHPFPLKRDNTTYHLG